MVRTDSPNPYYWTDVYAKAIRPLLFKLDPENAHDLIYRFTPGLQLIAPQLRALFDFEDPLLATELVNHKFSNPVGLAAGFDKNAKLGVLLDVLGLGFAEIGSLTNLPSKGNPKPRLFRLPEDQAIINRLGLNGDGVEVVAKRLAQLECKTPMSVNIAKTNDPSIVGDAAVTDLVSSFLAVRDLAIPYVTVNASCPNTHDGIVKEVRELQEAVSLMQEKNTNLIPLFIKLSPDSTDSLLESILELGRTCRVAGYVCANTSVSRENLKTSGSQLDSIGKGGLSGRPLKDMSLALCSRVMKQKESDQTVVACGGIASGAEVYQYLQLGVPAVQLYTALVYRGPGLIRSIKEELCSLLKRDGTSVQDVVRSAQTQPIGL